MEIHENIIKLKMKFFNSLSTLFSNKDFITQESPILISKIQLIIGLKCRAYARADLDIKIAIRWNMYCLKKCRGIVMDLVMDFDCFTGDRGSIPTHDYSLGK